MKKILMFRIIILLFLFTYIAFSASRRPDHYKDPNTGADIYTFYHGPPHEVDDGNGNVKIICDGSRTVVCKVIVVEGISGDIIPIGTIIDIWAGNELNGHGYLKCTVLADFDIYSDCEIINCEIYFQKDVSQPIENDYQTWLSKALNN